MDTKLHTATYAGNMHATASQINKEGFAEYVMHMEYSDRYTTVVFKMPAEMVHAIRTARKGYTSDPHHDDPEGM